MTGGQLCRSNRWQDEPGTARVLLCPERHHPQAVREETVRHRTWPHRRCPDARYCHRVCRVCSGESPHFLKQVFRSSLAHRSLHHQGIFSIVEVYLTATVDSNTQKHP
jgi:hypothetical protein